MYFVAVKFDIDKVKCVVKSTSIRNFHPSSPDDFDENVAYSVFWKGDENTQGGYYDAHIIHMAESEGEASALLQSKRRRLKPKSGSNSKAKGAREAAREEQNMSMFQKIAEIQGLRALPPARHQPQVPPQPPAQARPPTPPQPPQPPLSAQLSAHSVQLAELEKAHKKIKKLERSNSMLERALCSKVFQLETQLLVNAVPASCSCGRTESGTQKNLQVLTPPQLRPDLLSDEDNPPLVPEDQNDPLSDTLSFSQPSVQECQGDGLTDSSGCTSASGDMLAKQNAVTTAEQQPGSAIPVGTRKDDGTVHIGSNIWIRQDAWDSLMSCTKDSLFCRGAASAIWSSEVLACKSVTGRLPNTVSPEECRNLYPPLTLAKLRALKSMFRHYLVEEQNVKDNEELDKRLKKARVYLARKISDLRRPKVKACKRLPLDHMDTS